MTRRAWAKEVRHKCRRCSVPAQAAWREVFDQVAGRGAQGVRRFTIEEIAVGLGKTVEVIAPLLAELMDQGLVEPTDGGLWESRLVRKLAEIRSAEARRQKSARDKARDGARDKARCHARRPASAGAGSTSATESGLFDAERAGGAPLKSVLTNTQSSPTEKKSKRAAPAKPRKRLSRSKFGENKDACHTIHGAFVEWWCNEAYPQANGGERYEFGTTEDRSASWRIVQCRPIAFDLEKIKTVTLEFFREQRDLMLGGSGRRPLLHQLSDRIFGLSIRMFPAEIPRPTSRPQPTNDRSHDHAADNAPTPDRAHFRRDRVEWNSIDNKPSAAERGEWDEPDDGSYPTPRLPGECDNPRGDHQDLRVGPAGG